GRVDPRAGRGVHRHVVRRGPDQLRRHQGQLGPVQGHPQRHRPGQGPQEGRRRLLPDQERLGQGEGPRPRRAERGRHAVGARGRHRGDHRPVRWLHGRCRLPDARSDGDRPDRPARQRQRLHQRRREPLQQRHRRHHRAAEHHRPQRRRGHRRSCGRPRRQPGVLRRDRRRDVHPGRRQLRASRHRQQQPPRREPAQQRRQLHHERSAQALLRRRHRRLQRPPL
ncbi:MAG: hypothetical protein AVDCRST_MAG32-3085, partial [uncultured Nocardioides sp.]